MFLKHHLKNDYLLNNLNIFWVLISNYNYDMICKKNTGKPFVLSPNILGMQLWNLEHYPFPTR